MTFVILIPVYIIHCRSNKDDNNVSDESVDDPNKSDDDSHECCCSKSYKKALNDNVLSPFNDDDMDDDKSSNMSTTQTWYFYTNYAVVILLFICSFVSSIVYAVSGTIYDLGYCWIDSLYLAMIVLQLISQFCAIQSCFIFSKIVYKVTNKLDKLAEKMDKENKTTPINVSVPVRYNAADLVNAYDKGKEGIDREHYSKLLKRDRKFIKKVKRTLDFFGIWFVSHWTLYALTTVLLSAFIVETIVDILQYDFQSVDDLLPNSKVGTRASYCVYVVFFTLVHAYLFLYPCFRAAAIATARAKLISTISKKQWETFFSQFRPASSSTSHQITFQVPLGFCVFFRTCSWCLPELLLLYSIV